MKKLKLQMDDLRIETFDTTSATGQKGTVLGEQCTCQTQCSCQAASCFESCMWTCGPACVSNRTCEHLTCSGYATDWHGQCVIC